MTTITTRAGKGSPLTHTEMDTNFTNLNTAKLEDLDSRSSISPSLLLDFSNTGVLDPRITFARASVGKYINSIGRLVDAANNIPRFDWASTTQLSNKNLLAYTEDFNAWSKSAVTVTSNDTTAPDGTLTADKVIPDTSNTSYHNVFYTISGFISVGQTATLSLNVKAAGYNYVLITDTASGTYSARFNLSTGQVTNTSGCAANVTSFKDGWCAITITLTRTLVSGVITASILPRPTDTNLSTWTGDGTSGIYLWGAQLELGATATNYQAIAQPTTNTPLSAASTCNGLLIEESRANRLLWCRDATQSDWVKTNVIAVKDQTGIDGVANAASRIAASADGGTCIQTITLTSGSRTGSVYLKRLTGTGNIQVTLDGSRWSTVDLSNGLWNRITLSGTVTNPTVGIKIATNGDSVAMDYGQVEDGAFATSPILTTTTSVTRAADNAIMTGTNFSSWYRQDQGTVYSEFPQPSSSAAVFSIDDSSNSNSITINRDSALTNSAYIKVNGTNVVSLLKSTSVPAVGTFVKACFGYISGDFSFVRNADSPTTSITGSLPNVNRLLIGALNYGYCINGTIKRIMYYPKRLSNTELQSITS